MVIRSDALKPENNHKRFNKSMLAMCVMAVVHSQAYGQDPTGGQQDDELIEEILVSGVRKNIKNAQDLKRDAETFVDAISAEDIGELPDVSVLETLQRLPGLVIERFASPNDPDHFSTEGSNVTLRGLPQTRSFF